MAPCRDIAVALISCSGFTAGRQMILRRAPWPGHPPRSFSLCAIGSCSPN